MHALLIHATICPTKDLVLIICKSRINKSDAFVKNIVDLMRMNPDCALRILHAFRGDLARRISLTCDEVMRNHRKSYERKWLIQLIEIDTKEADIAAANEIYSVSKDVS